MLIGVERNINTGRLQLKMDDLEYIKSVEKQRRLQQEKQRIVEEANNKLDHYASENEQDAFYKALFREIENIKIDNSLI